MRAVRKMRATCTVPPRIDCAFDVASGRIQQLVSVHLTVVRGADRGVLDQGTVARAAAARYLLHLLALREPRGWRGRHPGARSPTCGYCCGQPPGDRRVDPDRRRCADRRGAVCRVRRSLSGDWIGPRDVELVI